MMGFPLRSFLLVIFKGTCVRLQRKRLRYSVTTLSRAGQDMEVVLSSERPLNQRCVELEAASSLN